MLTYTNNPRRKDNDENESNIKKRYKATSFAVCSRDGEKAQGKSQG